MIKCISEKRTYLYIHDLHFPACHCCCDVWGECVGMDAQVCCHCLTLRDENNSRAHIAVSVCSV